MRQVNEHSHPVHLPDDLLTEGTQTSVLSYTTRRVADIIVAIMTEGHIYNTLAPETLNKGEVLAYCVAILNTAHNDLFTVLFMFCKFLGIIAQSYMA